MESLGDRIKNLRKEKDLTQEEMGKYFNAAKSTISQYENNINVPDIETLKRMAEFFNVTVDYLLGRTDIRNPKKLLDNIKMQIPPDYPYKVTSRDKAQYRKHMEQLAETLFMDDETSDEDKEEIINIMNEIFWKAKLMNKRKPKKDK